MFQYSGGTFVRAQYTEWDYAYARSHVSIVDHSVKRTQRKEYQGVNYQSICNILLFIVRDSVTNLWGCGVVIGDSPFKSILRTGYGREASVPRICCICSRICASNTTT